MTITSKEEPNDAHTDYDTFTTRQTPSVIEENGKTIEPDVKLLVKTQSLGSALNPSPQTAIQRFMPSFFILCSSVLFSSMQSSVRYTNTNFGISPIFLTFFRGIVQTAFATIIILVFRNSTMSVSLDRRAIFLVMLRGVLGSVSILLKFAALTRLPVAIASSLFSTTPIFASLLGWAFLREGLTPTDKWALVMTTSASVLICASEVTVEPVAGTSSRLFHIVGVIFALCGAVTTASAFVLMRAMGTRVHFLFSVFTLGVCCAVSPFILYLFQSGDLRGTATFFFGTLVHAEKGAYFGFFCVVIFAIGGAMCFNRGAQLTAAGKIAMLRTFDIPISFLVAFLFLGEFPHSFAQLLACLLIAVSTCLVVMQSLS